MKDSSVFRFILLTGLCVILTATASFAESAGFRIDGFRWQGEPVPGGTVELYNPYGDIRCRASEDGKIHLQAVIQKFTAEHENFTFDIDRRGGLLKISPQFPAQLQLGAARVDMTLLLPPGTHLNARTTSGLIKVDRFRSKMVVQSDSGDIKIISALPVQAKSTSGHLSVRLTAAEWKNNSVLTTSTGQIKIILAEDAQGTLEAKTGGKISWFRLGKGSSELLEFSKSGLKVQLGDQGGALLVFSEQGNISFESRFYPRLNKKEPSGLVDHE